MFYCVKLEANAFSLLIFFSFGFCRRDCNTAAHVLAQFGSKADVDCSGWVDEAPPFVSDVVASDLAVHQG